MPFSGLPKTGTQSVKLGQVTSKQVNILKDSESHHSYAGLFPEYSPKRMLEPTLKPMLKPTLEHALKPRLEPTLEHALKPRLETTLKPTLES